MTTNHIASQSQSSIADRRDSRPTRSNDSRSLGRSRVNGPAADTSAADAAGTTDNRRDGFSSAPLLRRLGAAVIIAVLLVWWIGPATFVTYRGELMFDLGAHLQLVGWSMLAAIATGVPAGVALSRPSVLRHAERLMQIFNVGNTIPSLAVLVLSLAVLGIGDGPAIVALWLASVLPITRNTYEGLRQVPTSLRESAKGIGMTKQQSLLQVELPNALPMIFGGVRTAFAVNVGSAPLAFLIGADSLGTLIFPGIYLNNQPQLLLGAAATAVLALALDAIVAGMARSILQRRGLSQQAGA